MKQNPTPSSTLLVLVDKRPELGIKPLLLCFRHGKQVRPPCHLELRLDNLFDLLALVLAGDAEHRQVDFGLEEHVELVLLHVLHTGVLVPGVDEGLGSGGHLLADAVELLAELLLAAGVGTAHGVGGSCSTRRRSCSWCCRWWWSGLRCIFGLHSCWKVDLLEAGFLKCVLPFVVVGMGMCVEMGVEGDVKGKRHV